MIHIIVLPKRIGPILTCLILLLCNRMGLLAQNHSAAGTPASRFTLHVTHILGFEGISKNANGDLSIDDGALRFQKSNGSSAHLAIDSIQGLSIGEQDKQVGGMPMTLAKAAAPYGGGRVVSLFSHKKYDIITLEYLDPNGGFHGAIFQLNKGEGEVLKGQLEAKGVHVGQMANETAKPNTQETKSEVK